MAKTAEITSLLSKKNFVFDPYIIVKAKRLSMVDALYHIKKYPPKSELNSKEILEVNVNINK